MKARLADLLAAERPVRTLGGICGPDVQRQVDTYFCARGCVRKERRIYLWHNVRIHLDEAENLGSFLEFEAALAADADEATSQDRLGQLCARLGIRDDDHVAQSYSDLLGL